MDNVYYKKIKRKNKRYFENMYKDIGEDIRLDDEQINAVIDESQNALILAGAGAGKTTTIAAKVKYLIEKKGIESSQILMISFTNKAVSELKSRINIDFGLNVKIQTFHSLAYDIIKMIDKDLKIITDNENILLSIIKENITLSIRKNFKELFLDKKFEKTCVEFIKLIKTKNFNISDLMKLEKDLKKKKFLEFMNIIHIKYQEYLTKNLYMDYDDLIIKAIEYLDLIEGKIPYKYIFIDEYQDISIVRFNLIKKISCLTNCNLVVVGDDWQSIYSFSGSEIDLFYAFLKLKNVKILKITKTYRNSQELIDIAGKFIMRNTLQIRKKLKSYKKLKYPVEIIYYNDISNSYNNMLKKIRMIAKKNNLSDYAILSRYNFDIEKLKKEKFENKVELMTVHSSKGLGFKDVILINVSNDIYGFPSKIENDEYRNILIKTNQELEERRLFYVALTRTKNKIYILVPKSKPSIFIQEIEKYKNVKITK